MQELYYKRETGSGNKFHDLEGPDVGDITGVTGVTGWALIASKLEHGMGVLGTSGGVWK